jgi:cell division protein ZapA
MATESELVTVRILDREYQVMCAPGERRGLVDAAMFLDGRMREIRESGKLTSMDKIAVMCALNLSDELLRLRAEREERDEHVDRRLLELARRIDAGDAGS